MRAEPDQRPHEGSIRAETRSASLVSRLQTQEIRTLNSHVLLDIAIKQVQEEEPFKQHNNISEM